MAIQKLNAPTRLPSGEVTTIAKLDDEGRILWRESKSYGGAVCYIAQLIGSEGHAGLGSYIGWNVGKVAFRSRTGGAPVFSKAAAA